MNPAELLALVRDCPGISPGRIAERLGASPSLVSYHLKQLEAGGRLVAVWHDGKRRVFVLSPEADL